MFRYYQTDEKSRWQVIKESRKLDKELKEVGARKVTILSLSAPVDDDDPDGNRKIRYKGPLYFDIDSKDLREATESARTLVHKLKEYGVHEEDIEIYCSGSKGYHILVPYECIVVGKTQGVPLLPLIYKRMAMELYVPGLDFQVYSMGRGVTWRLPNMPKKEGGHRVRITHQELEDMTVEAYRDFTSQPRIMPAREGQPQYAEMLGSLFRRCEKEVAEEQQRPLNTIKSQALVETLQGELPPCIEDMATFNVRSSVNFNRLAFQFALTIVRSGADRDTANEYARRLSENGESRTYNTVQKRRKHIEEMLKYVSRNKDAGFSCNAIRGTVVQPPCQSCPVNDLQAKQENLAGNCRIVDSQDGYLIEAEKSSRLITNFILEPEMRFKVQPDPENNDDMVEVSTIYSVRVGSEVVGKVEMENKVWVSSRDFKMGMMDIQKAEFIGSESDVQKIKTFVHRDDLDVGEIILVDKHGINFHRIGKRLLKVYVEGDYSINEKRIQGTHRVRRNTVPVVARLSSLQVPEKGSPVLTEGMESLFQMNEPEVIAQMIGWFSACHLKAQIARLYSQFPVLNLWGNAGSGKTVTSSVFSWLAGVPYLKGVDADSLPNTSYRALLEICSSSTTVPRILEEFNQSMMATRSYSFCTEIMKSAWNGQTVSKGTLAGRGSNRHVAVNQFSITSPLCVISEQAPTQPALVHRMVQVHLASQGHEGRETYLNNVFERHEEFMRFGRALMVSALIMSDQDLKILVEDAMDCVPKLIVDRSRYGYGIIVAGIVFFQQVCDELKLGHVVDVEWLKKKFLDHLNQEVDSLSKSKNVTEIDHFVDTLLAMIVSSDAGADDIVKKGVHWIQDEDSLYINLHLCIGPYMLQCRRTGQRTVFTSYSQVRSLIEGEPYFVGEVVKSEFGMKGKLVQLNKSKMAEKGLHVEQLG